VISINSAGKAGHKFFKPSFIPVLIALVVVVSGAIFAEWQNKRVFHQSERTEVLNKVSLIRARLEGNINANIQLVRGLVSTIATEPDIDQARFAELAGSLFSGTHQLRNVAGAPDLVIAQMYPMQGNESAIGLDYRINDAQRAAALQARDSRELVMAGPVDLVQGGTGFIGRFPVFTSTEQGGAFWGIVSAVVDTERLYANSGLTADLPFDVALRGKDGTGADGPLFYGSEAILERDPVTAEIVLPHGTWQIAATPKGGWTAVPDNVWTIRGFALLAGLLVAVPMLVVGGLLNERYGHLRELHESEIALQRVSRRLELALEASQVGVWENDLSNERLFWDRRMRELYDVPSEGDVNYKTWRDCLHPHDVERAVEEFYDAINNLKPYRSQFRVVHTDGAVRTIKAMGSVICESDGSQRILGANWDITEDVERTEQLHRAKLLSEARNSELETAKASIEYNALHDSLTGLPNRRYLDQILSGRSEFGFDAKSGYGLLQIDLDRFKQINDTLGHAAGDAMLMHAAKILRENVRKGDFVARIGGDEFVIVCLADADSDFLAALAERLVDRMRQPAMYKGRECRIGVSIGIACCTNDRNDPRELLVNADIALYRAKNEGRNGFRMFSDDLHAAAVRTKRVADEILTGLEQGHFIPYYQGQFDATTLEITGVEALARWKHPEKGLLMPSAFVDIAEDLSVMHEIDAAILTQSLDQLKRWHKRGVNVPRVAVNVSARRLQDELLIDKLKQMNFERGTLAFELVESIFLDESGDVVSWNIDQLKELGIEVEIDDFGTGYASIVSLMKLEPTRLKIDRQLVKPTVDSEAQRKLVKSIVDIGAAMGIESVAEGIETMDHARIMKELGCTTLQGYELARPMSSRAFASFYRSHTKGLSKKTA